MMAEKTDTNTALIASLRAALTATPDAVPLWKHLGDLLLASGDVDSAVDAYKKALDGAPEDVTIKRALADAYYRQGRPEVALIILEELLGLPTPTPAAYLLAARAYLDNDEPAKAASAYRQAMVHDPALADAALQQALTLAVPQGADADSPSEDDKVFVTVEGAAQEFADFMERPSISFEDVGGMEQLKEEIRMKIIYPLTHPEIFEAYGKTAGGGILMYGPPGCGKTYLARATAGEVKAHFISVGLHDVLDMYLGQSERKLHAIFELARQANPCVLFFDEVDALGAKRSDMRHSAARQVINQFLSELDGVTTSNAGILVLAATNAPWHLDGALRRPGRFDRVIFVPPPDTPARAAILHLMLDGKPVGRIDYARLARQTRDFSGADLQGIVTMTVEQKLREAMRTGTPPPITTGDLLTVAKTVRPTTQEWFATARNYALYANEGGLYDEIARYLKL
jgi:SpoVK/Ycf46/Vps4 family AAA+-type ATPase